MEKAVIFDVEGDGLTPKKLHCLSFSDEDEKNVETIFDYDGMRTFFTSYDIYIGHNIRRWDIPVIERILGIEIKGLIIDTLALSWYLQPKRPKHNLESYGEEYGIKKPAIPDWADLAKEVYRNRCEQDVKINKRVWQDQIKYLTKLYPDRDDLIPFLRYLSFKMYAAHLAEKSRWKLDVERCNASLQRLNLERTQKLDELTKVMPPVPVVKSHVAPKRMYNSDGQLSLLGQKWTDRLVAGGFDEGYEGPIEEISGYDEPNPSSHKQVKDWLYSLGWVPQTIKYQKNKETGEIKEIPQINKEHGAGICESIKDLYEKEPRLELLDGLSVLSHRISLLNGFIRDVDDEGYIRAAVQGLTNTLRFKHAVVVNLPKVGVAYGDDIRGCLIADSGNELCGADMSSLEDRIKQHFIYKHDPDYVDELNRPDYDPHLDLAYVVNQIDAKLGLTAEQVQTYKDGKDDGTIKKARGIFKNGNYALERGM